MKTANKLADEIKEARAELDLLSLQYEEATQKEKREKALKVWVRYVMSAGEIVDIQVDEEEFSGAFRARIVPGWGTK